mgnify:CR=1 FL=1
MGQDEILTYGGSIMKAHKLLFLAVCGLMGFLLAAQAQDQPSKSAPQVPGKIREDSTLEEQILARKFAEFEQDLYKLILKLKRSAKEGDKERAEVLEKVLERAKTNLIGVQFEQLVGQLKDQKIASTSDIKIAADRSAKLADELRTLIAIWKEDPRQLKLRDEINRLKDIIKELEKAIHDQKVTQGITDAKKTDPKELGRIQKKNTQQVAKLIDKMDGKKGGKGDPKDGKGSKGDPKAAKSGDKAAQSKDGGKGEPKEGGDPKKGNGKPGEGQPGQPKPGGDQGEQKPDDGAQKPQPPQGPKDNIASSKKKIEEGNYNQKSAEDKIKKEDNPEASKEQDKAIENFEAAKKKLEDLLRQLREEELERTLADLLRRCEKMLAMQISVYNGTKNVFAAVEKNPDKEPSRENKQDSLKLSDQEGEIVVEARKAIEVLEAEGSAVAFPEVFQQVRDDMTHVQRRLGVSDVGIVTQTIEQDIIDSLKEMIEALKKAKADLDKNKNSPPSSGGPPPDQKLLELIQELKLIRSLQIRVNTRTTTYGRMYQAKEGEQTSDPGIRRELINLSERQERIFEVTNRLAKGDNK